MIIEEMIFLNGACSPRGNGLLFFAPDDLRFTIKNLSYILWCIAPQVKRSLNEVLLEP